MEIKQQQDAIDVDVMEQEEEQIEAKLDCKTTIGKTSFDMQLSICQESNQEDSQLTIMRRLIKFFEYNKEIEPGREYFCPRKEAAVNSNADMIDNQIIIYGCDFKKLKLVKQEYETGKAITINPSNTKLVYSDRGTAWKAIQKNALNPELIVMKQESEDDPLPRCWFEMKPYEFHNRSVQVFARFATEEEREIQPRKQEWMMVYRDCREIYNEQQQNLLENAIANDMAQREKIEKNKNKNSDSLYSAYQKNNNKEWKKGINENPGAHRDQRQRSRQKENKGQKSNPFNQENDNESNYSFIFSKSKKDMSEVNLAFNGMNLGDSIIVGGLDTLGKEKASVALNGKLGEYNWGGQKARDDGSSSAYTWSYTQYMKKKEEEEEAKRLKIKKASVAVITIQDD